MNCNICPRHCNVNRDVKTGFCGVSNELKVAKACLHFWEEPPISGEKGSGTIFFSGCNLKCVFCQNYEVSRGFGKEITIKRLVDIYKELEDKGANNINLVTASHFVPQIVKSFEIYKPAIPIVYNSSGYESIETLKLLDGIVDVYLPDLKYSDNELAYKYSKCKDYFLVATKAILEMKRQQPKDIIKNGLMKKGVIIRHLILPNELNNTDGVLNWFNNNLTKDSFISLMGQFTPFGQAKDIDKLNRPLKPLEYKIEINKLLNMGFKNSFIQELDSSSKEYIPDFNLDGV